MRIRHAAFGKAKFYFEANQSEVQVASDIFADAANTFSCGVFRRLEQEAGQ